MSEHRISEKLPSTFFLTTAGEGDDLTAPRSCTPHAYLSDGIRDDHMLIGIDPPLVGQKYGLGDRDIVDLLISPRHKGVSLSPITQWPTHVYVSRVLDERIKKTLMFTESHVQLIAWGMIYRTLDEANAHAAKFERRV